MVAELDEGLQSRTHSVTRALAVDEAFDESYIESHLTRALLCGILCSVRGVEVVEMPNGGCELRIPNGDSKWRFRFRRAARNSRNGLEVTVSSDSLLAHRASTNARLFEWPGLAQIVDDREPLWVLAYLINPMTRTLLEAWAVEPVGLLGNKPPFKLALGTVLEVPLTFNEPPRFTGEREDLRLPGEELGGAASPFIGLPS